MKYWPLMALLLSLPAVAHQQKAAITTVLFNDHSGQLEVMHRFYLHDAEHGVRQVLNPEADIFSSEQTRADFSRYVAEQFALYSTAGDELLLNLVGSEIDGNFFWVYQSMPIPAPIAGMRIEHNALREVWPEQINTVNIERDGAVQTVTFAGDAVRLPVLFDKEQPIAREQPAGT